MKYLDYKSRTIERFQKVAGEITIRTKYSKVSPWNGNKTYVI